MFPLKTRKIVGYSFGQRTWYGVRHLGVDYQANFENLYAPFDGQVVNALNGLQGGKTIWFKPDGKDVIIRFMHLDQFIRTSGRVKEGEVIAKTGNSGLLTTAPHCHIDISMHQVDVSHFSNFIDPEKFDWDSKGGFPKTVEIIVPVANVRKEPTVSSPLSGSMKLYKGDRFVATDKVVGENVKGNNLWYRSTRGNYVWSGCCREI